MEKKDIINLMLRNTVFMGSMDTRFGLLQTVQSLAQAVARSPEPVKGALAAELGDIICLAQMMIMQYGGGHASVPVGTDALNKVGEFVRCDISEIIRDLEAVYGDGVIITAHTLATWADQTLNGQLWERASEDLGIAVKTA